MSLLFPIATPRITKTKFVCLIALQRKICGIEMWTHYQFGTQKMLVSIGMAKCSMTEDQALLHPNIDIWGSIYPALYLTILEREIQIGQQWQYITKNCIGGKFQKLTQMLKGGNTGRQIELQYRFYHDMQQRPKISKQYKYIDSREKVIEIIHPKWIN